MFKIRWMVLLVAADEEAAGELERLEATRLEMIKQQDELDKLLLNDGDYQSAQRNLARARARVANASRYNR